MKRGRSNITSSTAPYDLDGLELVFRRHPRARRMRLRYDAERDRLLLTLPPRASQARARAWARSQSDWIAEQRAARPPSIPLAPGEHIPFCGEELLLVHDPAASRRLHHGDGRLVGGGPEEAFPARVHAWLRRAARDRLSEDVAFYAEKARVTVTGVAIGDARTRWGSCSPEGKLRFSWRLVCAPPEVRRYVAAHEVAHRRHMDHGPDFHAFEEELYGAPTRPARRLLRELGPRLQRIGR
ncbi:M48 family metallopeptidase [Sphingomicrobium lutaoense]|uniref:YgjP-like metallopeptidase domain-containing protein n=1 Tax=Sphingomicrobium lutaoense TaxID=515949 RepID=A0A839Z0C3_9SPHN|nr:SprT family zinc-dependent metalloprotease [Sphingomicrobium lutaoense]MBB3764809.1 hypothetical protein [Sphingomicrobium lutaoense]